MKRNNYFFEALLAWSRKDRSMWHLISGSYIDFDENNCTAPWDKELRKISMQKWLKQLNDFR